MTADFECKYFRGKKGGRGSSSSGSEKPKLPWVSPCFGGVTTSWLGNFQTQRQSQRVGTHVICVSGCCVSHIGLAQETDVSYVRITEPGISCAFMFHVFSTGKHWIIGLCPKVEQFYCCYATSSSARGGRGDHLYGQPSNWGYQDGGVQVHLTTLNMAVDVALNAEFTFKSA